MVIPYGFAHSTASSTISNTAQIFSCWISSALRNRTKPTKDYGFCVLRYKNGLSFVKTCAAEINGAARRSLIISGTEGSFEIQPIELPRDDGRDDTIARETIGAEPGFDHSRPVVFPPHLRYD